MSESKAKKEIEMEISKTKESQDTTAKTGSCHISVATGNYCFNGLTQKGCSDTATKFGGTSTWVEGARCG